MAGGEKWRGDVSEICIFLNYKRCGRCSSTRAHAFDVGKLGGNAWVARFFGDVVASEQKGEIGVFNELLMRGMEIFECGEAKVCKICREVRLRRSLERAFSVAKINVAQNILLFAAAICRVDQDVASYIFKESFLSRVMDGLENFGCQISDALCSFLSAAMMRFEESFFRKFNEFVNEHTYDVRFAEIYVIFSSVVEPQDITHFLPCIVSSFEHKNISNAVLMTFNIIQIAETYEEKEIVFDMLFSSHGRFLDYIFEFLILFDKDSLVYAFNVISFCLSIDTSIISNQEICILLEFLDINDSDIQIGICDILYYLFTSNETAEIVLSSNSNIISILFSFVKGTSYELKKKSLITLCLSISHVTQNEMDFLIQKEFMEELVSFADPDDIIFGKIILKCIITQLNRFEQSKGYILHYIELLQNFYSKKDKTIDLYFYIIQSYYLKNDDH